MVLSIVTTCFAVPATASDAYLSQIGDVHVSVATPKIKAEAPKIDLVAPTPQISVGDVARLFSGYDLPFARADENVASLVQDGDDNVGGSIQQGLGNASLISQTGSKNFGYTWQSGSRNVSATYQSGSGMRAAVVQLGSRNTAMIIQSN